MDSSQSPNSPLATTIKWLARFFSILIISVMLFFFIGEGLLGDNSKPLETTAIIQLGMAGIELLGLALAWKWEVTGGSITLIVFVCKGIINPRAFAVPLMLIPFTAVLFLLSWWISHKSVTPEIQTAPPTNA